MGVTSIPTWDVIFRRVVEGPQAAAVVVTMHHLTLAMLRGFLEPRRISRGVLGADFGEIGFGSQPSDDLELFSCPHEFGTAPQFSFLYKKGWFTNEEC